MEMDNGYLVISLDFELLWGIFDKVDWRDRQKYLLNTRKVIPKILETFEKNGIACTWATVGMLFNENWDEWLANIPQDLPQYDKPRLSAYSYGNAIASKETEELCFAPNLIRLIASTPKQEVGTHTYSHYYCLEKGQSIKSFSKDLRKAKELAEGQNIQVESLVFPRNQFNQEYLNICGDLGITNVRTNPQNWYWENTQKDSLVQKFFRTGDAYIGPKDKSYPSSGIKELEKTVVGHKASRFFRPPSNNVFMDQLRLKRITSEMTYAAKHHEIYHLWWHPHNFGQHPDDSLRDLMLLLDHYKWCNEKYGFNSQNMRGLNKAIK